MADEQVRPAGRGAHILEHGFDLREEDLPQEEFASAPPVHDPVDEGRIGRVDLRPQRMKRETRAFDERAVVLEGRDGDTVTATTEREPETEKRVDVAVRAPAGEDDPRHFSARTARAASCRA